MIGGLAGSLRHRVWPGPTNQLFGWIRDAARPGDEIRVRVMLELRWGLPPIDVGTVIANNPRHIEVIDGIEISCGFECRVPVLGDAVKIRAYEANTNVELDGSPIHLGIAPRFEGFLDSIGTRHIAGWAWAARPDYRCEIDIVVDGRYLATTFAVTPREDLFKAGIGHGEYGFVHPLPTALFDGAEHEFACYFHGTRRELGGSPKRVRLEPFVVRAAIGSDDVLRGTIYPNPVLDQAQLRFDLLLNHRPVAKLVAHRASPDLPYRFAVPAPGGDGSIEIALVDDDLPPSLRRSYPVISNREAAETPAPVTSGGRVDAIERQWISRFNAERALPSRKSRLLVPVWGESYIEMFCRLCLPSLLSENNLPRYVEQHQLIVTILTRSADVARFERFPAIVKLRQIADIAFISIDDILESFFDPRPRDIYSMALTYAFFRGIKSCGEEATSTDFIFWNADFLAGDGTFGHLADIIARGGRCTMSASIRADLSILDELRGMLSADGTQLQIGSRDLVRTALAHPHPTVAAQTLNENSGQILANIINRLCWKVDDDVLIGRYFLLYMLHIRPERVWEDVNGPCDYVFVPEMVPSEDITYECNSDNICIIEPQNRTMEGSWIKSEPFDFPQIAGWIDYWATHEHIEYSKNLVIFNGSRDDIESNLNFATARSILDRSMSEIYQRLGEDRIWHNLHVYWRSCYDVLGRDAPTPAPERPRSRLANITRWTGYDLDVVIDGWRGQIPASVRELLRACPSPVKRTAGSMSRWFDELFETSLAEWLSSSEIPLIDQNPMSLVAVHYRRERQLIYSEIEFFGCWWGSVVQLGERWYRLLGSDGGALLLHRTTQRSAFAIMLRGCRFGGRDPSELTILINDCPVYSRDDRLDRIDGPEFTIHFGISRDQVIACEGRLVIKIVDPAITMEVGQPGFGFHAYVIEPTDLGLLEESVRELAEIPIATPWLEHRLRSNIGSTFSSSLKHLRKFETNNASFVHLDVDLGGSFLGLGWDKPFRYNGSFWRWIKGNGAELLVVRLRPGQDYDLCFEAARELTHPSLVVGCNIEVNGAPLPLTKTNAEASIYRLTGRLSSAATLEYNGWIAIRLIAPMSSVAVVPDQIEYGRRDASSAAPKSAGSAISVGGAPTPLTGLGGIATNGAGELTPKYSVTVRLGQIDDALPVIPAFPALIRPARIEYGEPETGGIAAGVFRAYAMGPTESSQLSAHTATSTVRTTNSEDPTTAFWRNVLGDLPGLVAPDAGPREKACVLLGVDPTRYEVAVCSHGDRVLGSWTCCPLEAVDDVEVASLWLSGVDREIAAVWRATERPAREDGFAVTSIDEIEGTGFGQRARLSRFLGRQLPSRHSMCIFLWLDRAKSWTVAFEFECDRTQRASSGIEIFLDDQPVEEIFLDDQPVEAVDIGIAGETMRLLVTLPEDRTILSAGPVAFSIRKASRAADLGGLTLVGVRGVVGAQLSGSNARFAPPGLYTFAATAEEVGLDPALYIKASERGSAALREAMLKCPVATSSAPALRRTLFAHYDYLLTANMRVNTTWREESCTIDLLGDFDGVGWGKIDAIDGNPARLVGPWESSLVFAMAREDGAMEVEFECAGPLPRHSLERLDLIVNGTLLHSIEEIITESKFRLRGAFILDPSGYLALGVFRKSASGAKVGVRSVTLRRLLKAHDGIETVVFGAASSAPLGCTIGLGLPIDVKGTPQLPGIGRQDAVLRVFGRDPFLYRTWVAVCGERMRAIFESCPRGPAEPSYTMQAWLDLLDRKFLEALISGAVAPEVCGCPVLGRVYGLDWGPLIVGPEGSARTLSGAGDATILIGPQSTPNYKVEFDFSSDSPSDVLLRLKVSVNRRDAVTQVLTFGSEGPRMTVEIDPSTSEFGLGWVALRLAVADVNQSEIDVAFRGSVELADWKVSVRKVTLRSSGAAVPLATQAEQRTEQLPGAVHCVVPVWGDEYLKTYLELCLPAHLAPGNLSALTGTRVIYEIYTDAPGRGAIEQHPLYQVLSNTVDEVLFFGIEDVRKTERARSVHSLNLNYAIMNNCHQKSIKRASTQGGALLFLNCDTVYSENIFARVWELAQRGYRSVENLSIRTDRDKMLDALMEYRSPDGRLAIGSSELTRIALPRFHWIALNRYWEGPPGMVIPDHLYWRVSETAILVHATHYMPLFVFPRLRDVDYLGTIDHGFIPSAGIIDTERWFMASADEPSSYEMSLASHDQRFKPFERGSARDIARFLGLLCEHFHVRNLVRPVRIAADAVSKERWHEVEEHSAAIIDEIRRRLQYYVLTPGRPDWVAEADECQLGSGLN
jgi:hypothetical protein